MDFKDVFSKAVGLAKADYFNSAPSQELGNSSYTSVNSERSNQKAFRTIIEDEQKKKEKRDANDDFVEMASIAIRQAYEDFQNFYAETMAFYDDADKRLDELEARINQRLQEMESKTELLTDDNGNAVYRDENGGFYKVENGQRMAITEEDEIESLREKVKAIEATGQTVRTENEQAVFVELQNTLTETMDLQRDAERNRDEAEEWKRRVEEDHSQAPGAHKRIQEGREDIEKRMKEMEQRVNGLDAKKERLDKQITTDQTSVATTVNDWKSSVPTDKPPAPPAGL